MHDPQLLVKVLESNQYLPHDHPDLVLFIQFYQALSSLLLDVLGQAHVHSLKDEVETTVLVLDAFRFHHVGAVLARTSTINRIKALQHLHLPLVKGFLLGGELVLELLNSVLLTALDVFALVYMTKAAGPNHVTQFELIPYYKSWLLRRIKMW